MKSIYGFFLTLLLHTIFIFIPNNTVYAYETSCATSSSCGDCFAGPTCSRSCGPTNPGQYECCISCGTPGSTAPPGGGGPAACRNATVNCPAGQVKATNQPLNVFPEIDNGYQMCAPGIGTAQAISGCVTSIKDPDDGSRVCVNNEITTYGCCPTGQTSTITYTSGATYTKANSCATPTTCNDSDDLYISHVNNPASVCYTDCARYNQKGNCAEPITVYNVITTCQTRTPVYTCTGPINGVCSSTHYNCTAGTVTNPVSGATTWTWNCVGTTLFSPILSATTFAFH